MTSCLVAPAPEAMEIVEARLAMDSAGAAAGAVAATFWSPEST